LAVFSGQPEYWRQKWATSSWTSRGTVVTDGIESALEQARAVAGDRDIAVCAANVAQQFITAGLLDEIQISLVPILLGDGVPLLANLENQQLNLECVRVVESDGVTHLRYRILK
jgi:dihydrofolate reductase